MSLLLGPGSQGSGAESSVPNPQAAKRADTRSSRSDAADNRRTARLRTTSRFPRRCTGRTACHRRKAPSPRGVYQPLTARDRFSTSRGACHRHKAPSPRGVYRPLTARDRFSTSPSPAGPDECNGDAALVSRAGAAQLLCHASDRPSPARCHVRTCLSLPTPGGRAPPGHQGSSTATRQPSTRDASLANRREAGRLRRDTCNAGRTVIVDGAGDAGACEGSWGLTPDASAFVGMLEAER